MFIDSHSHPYMHKKKTLDQVIKSFKDTWWKYLVSIGVDLDTSRQSIELSKKYNYIYATIWLHPTDALQYHNNLSKTIGKLQEMIQSNDKIVWIWECGLDYYWLDTLSKEHNITKEEVIDFQKESFIWQIQLAEKYNLPFIIHNRNAKKDTFDIITACWYKNFILHCYSEDLEFAKKCIAFAPKCKISFSGIVTFNNAKEIQETAKKIPLENIIIETDSPYLTPVPYRWKEENEAAYTRFILDKIIELRSEHPEIVEKKIYENTKKVFQI